MPTADASAPTADAGPIDCRLAVVRWQCPIVVNTIPRQNRNLALATSDTTGPSSICNPDADLVPPELEEPVHIWSWRDPAATCPPRIHCSSDALDGHPIAWITARDSAPEGRPEAPVVHPDDLCEWLSAHGL